MVENDIFCYSYTDESIGADKNLKNELKSHLSCFNLGWEKTKYNYEDCTCPMEISCLYEHQCIDDVSRVELDDYRPLNDDPTLTVEESSDFPILISPLQTYTKNIQNYIHSYLHEKFHIIFDFYVVDTCNLSTIKAKLEVLVNAPLTRNHTFFIINTDNGSEEDLEKTINILDAFTAKHKYIYYDKVNLGDPKDMDSVYNSKKILFDSITSKIRTIFIDLGEAYLKKIDSLFVEYKAQNSAGFTSRFNFFRITSKPDPAIQKLKNKEMLSKILHLNLYFYYIGKHSIFYHYNKLIIKECFKCRSLSTLLTCLYTQLNLLKQSYFHKCVKNEENNLISFNEIEDSDTKKEQQEGIDDFKRFYCDEFIRFAVQFNKKLQENEFEFGNNELSEVLDAVALNGSNDNEYKRIYYIFVYIKFTCLDFAFLIKYRQFYKEIFSMALHYIDKLEYELKLLVLKQVVYFLYYSKRIMKSHLVRKALYYDMTLIKISNKAPQFCNILTEEVTSNKYYLNITDLINEILFLKIKKCLKEENQEGCFNIYYSIINHYNRKTSKTPQHYLEITNNKCGKFYMAKAIKLLQKHKQICLNPAFFSIEPEYSHIKISHEFFKDPAIYNTTSNEIECYENSTIELNIQLCNNLIFELELNTIELVVFNKTENKHLNLLPQNIITKNISIGPISSFYLKFSFKLNSHEWNLCYIKVATSSFHDKINLDYDLNENFGFINNNNNIKGSERFQTVGEETEDQVELNKRNISVKSIHQPISITEDNASEYVTTSVGCFIPLSYDLKTVNNMKIGIKCFKSYNYKIWNYSLRDENNSYKLHLLVYISKFCILKSIRLNFKLVIADTEHNICIDKPLKCAVDANCDIRKLEQKKWFLHVSPRQEYSMFDNTLLIDHRATSIYFKNNDISANSIHKQNNIVEYNKLKEENTEVPSFIKPHGGNLNILQQNITKELEKLANNSLYLSEKLVIGKYDISSIISANELNNEFKIHKGVIKNEFTDLLSQENNTIHEKEILGSMFTYTTSANKLEQSLYNVSFYCKSTFNGSSFVKIQTKDKLNHYEWIDDGLSNVEIEMTPGNNEIILHKRINVEEPPKHDSYEIIFIVKGKYKDIEFNRKAHPIIFK